MVVVFCQGKEWLAKVNGKETFAMLKKQYPDAKIEVERNNISTLVPLASVDFRREIPPDTRLERMAKGGKFEK